jgi:DNA-binding response OmpR family regulator
MELAREMQPQVTPSAVTVLVMDVDEAIRGVLGDLLEDSGYPVVKVGNFHDAQTLSNAAPEPMLLVIGNGEVPDDPGLQFFSEAAASPTRRHAYIYLTTDTNLTTTIPTLSQEPELDQVLTSLEVQRFPKPFELQSFLAAVDAATKWLHA